MTARSSMPDRLLEGEDPGTSFARDARHWITVYREMIGFKEDLLGRVEERIPRLPQAARADVMENDIMLIRNQLERYRRRLDFWFDRHWQLEGLLIDDEERTIGYRERTVALSRREFQLFSLLLAQSPKFVSPSRLLVDAWHDGNLPQETLRTYIVRLRAKLASLGGPASIENQPRRGYAIVFRERPNKGGERPS